MALYMNESKGNLYCNEQEPSQNNQTIYIHNRETEWVKEQKRFNEAIESNLHEIQRKVTKQHGVQLKQSLGLEEKLGSMEQTWMKQAQMEQKQFQEIASLKFEQKEILESLTSQLITEEKAQQRYEQIIKKLETITEENEHLSQQMALQLDEQRKLADQFSNHQAKTNELEKRLEHQEAIGEKVTRQLDYFRSLIFERTNDLAEKIEDVKQFFLGMFTEEKNSSEQSQTRKKIKIGQ